MAKINRPDTAKKERIRRQLHAKKNDHRDEQFKLEEYVECRNALTKIVRWRKQFERFTIGQTSRTMRVEGAKKFLHDWGTTEKARLVEELALLDELKKKVKGQWAKVRNIARSVKKLERELGKVA